MSRTGDWTSRIRPYPEPISAEVRWMSPDGSVDRPDRPRDLPWLSLVTVRGPSMVPALHPGNRLLAVRVRDGGRSPARLRPGAIVLAEWGSRPGLLVIKRLVRPTSDGFWVEGDNAHGSDDSRKYGPATVRAVVLIRCWPWPAWIRATLRR